MIGTARPNPKILARSGHTAKPLWRSLKIIDGDFFFWQLHILGHEFKMLRMNLVIILRLFVP